MKLFKNVIKTEEAQVMEDINLDFGRFELDMNKQELYLDET